MMRKDTKFDEKFHLIYFTKSLLLFANVQCSHRERNSERAMNKQMNESKAYALCKVEMRRNLGAEIKENVSREKSDKNMKFRNFMLFYVFSKMLLFISSFQPLDR
jgi:hypothetical protein